MGSVASVVFKGHLTTLVPNSCRFFLELCGLSACSLLLQMQIQMLDVKA